VDAPKSGGGISTSGVALREQEDWDEQEECDQRVQVRSVRSCCFAVPPVDCLAVCLVQSIPNERQHTLGEVVKLKAARGMQGETESKAGRF
jgi:hypothetical protein